MLTYREQRRQKRERGLQELAALDQLQKGDPEEPVRRTVS